MEQLANNPVTTLNGAIDASIGNLVVSDASLFPTTGNFVLKIDSELFKVTSVSGTMFFVNRGVEGTTAASHADAAAVTLIVSSGVIANLFAEGYQVGSASLRPVVARKGTIYAANDMDYRWRHDGTNWDLIHPCYVPYANRIDLSSWTALNQGTSTWTDTNGVMRVMMPSSTTNLRGFYKTIPSAPWTITVAVGTSPVLQFRNHWGLFLYDTGTTRCWGCNLQSSTGTLGVGNVQLTAPTSISGLGNERWVIAGRVHWLRWIDNNTNWLFQFSPDGNRFTTFGQFTRNTFLTPTHVGIMCQRSWNNPTHDIYYEFFGYWES